MIIIRFLGFIKLTMAAVWEMNCSGAGGGDCNPRNREMTSDISTMGFLNCE